MLKWLVLLLAILLTGVGNAAFTIFSVNGSPAVTCNVTTGVAVGLGAGTCLSPAATCDGVADDSAAFAAFNTWALTWQASYSGQVGLLIPGGGSCLFLSDTGSRFASGIRNLLVLGYGATLASSGVSFFLGGGGQYPDASHSARLATVSTGASSVTLLNGSLASLFTVGQYALITGYDLQGLWEFPYGYPSNPYYFEYVLVTAINGNTVSFSAPLVNTYKSTWPNYNSGDANQVDSGGPATLYALPPSWNTVVEYRGLTISQTEPTYANGRSVTYRNVVFPDGCANPSQNAYWALINTTILNCIMEPDKLVETMSITGGIINSLEFQSSSINRLDVSGTTFVTSILGTPKKTTILNSTIPSFSVGATSYGRTNEVSCTNCAIATLLPRGILHKGPSDAGVNVGYTMSGGVISIPNTYGAVSWAVPGTNLMWSAQFSSETAFRVTDVTQDATYTYVATTLSGGFPGVPLTGGKIYIQVHPAPKFTCRSCTGNVDVVDLSSAPAAAPLYSYSSRTYATSVSLPLFQMWGTVSSIGINVTSAYAGVTNPLTLETRVPVIKPDYSTVNYDAVVNLRQSGNRVITSTGVTCDGSVGACSGDTGMTLPNASTWLADAVTTMFNSSFTGMMEVTVTIQTDQGVVNP